MLEYLDLAVEYVREGLSFVRGLVENLSGFAGVEPSTFTTVAFLIISLFFGNFITKRFVTKPFAGTYLPWTLLISFNIFLILKYL